MKKYLFLYLLLFSVLFGCNRPIPIIYATPTLKPSQTYTPTVFPSPSHTSTPKSFLTATPSLTPSQTQVPSSTPIPLPQNYLIQPGDTLSEISNRYQVPLILIILVNQINDTNLIVAGETIIIPNPESLPPEIFSEEKRIMVVLSEQKVYVFEDNALQKEFVVSTGLPNTPTVTGVYKIVKKIDKTRMTGPGYDLIDVPWVMYFYQGYSFHGTYWHNNFGVPMSHGCVNMKTEDAKWLYDWSPLGTIVEVIP